MSIYTDKGYKNRDDYLKSLSEDIGIDLATVREVAALLGPNEDFDGLVTTLEDHADGWT